MLVLSFLRAGIRVWLERAGDDVAGTLTFGGDGGGEELLLEDKLKV